MSQKSIKLCLIILFTVGIIGCAKDGETGNLSAVTPDESLGEEAVEDESEEIVPFDGQPSQVFDRVYTTEGKMALTINGLNELVLIEEILERLEELDLQASFFVTDDDLIHKTEVLEAIIEAGHDVELKISDQYKIKDMEYEEIYLLLKDMQERLQGLRGKETIFVRKNSTKTQKDLELIVAQLEMGPMIGHSIRPTGLSLEDDEVFERNLRRSFQRGGIISFDAKDHEHVLWGLDILKEELEDLQYEVLPLDDLMALDQERKPFEEIEGHDLLAVNLEYDGESPNVFYKQITEEKLVALTFDDYGSDRTVNQILDILDEHKIQSTFFLKGSNVVRNPNLAKVILDRGHEIANHSHSHERSTELERQELQEDLIEAHRAITEAIQEQPTMLFRPPFGNIDEETAKVISAIGYQNIAMYDISSYDWNLDYSLDDVIQRVMNNVGPGSVIVMHMNDGIHNLDALPILIDLLKEEGYGFVKMGEWFEDLP